MNQRQSKLTSDETIPLRFIHQNQSVLRWEQKDRGQIIDTVSTRYVQTEINRNLKTRLQQTFKKSGRIRRNQHVLES